MSEMVTKHSLAFFLIMAIPLAWIWWVQMYLGLWPQELIVIPSTLGGISPILSLAILDRLSDNAVGLERILNTARTWRRCLVWLILAAISYPLVSAIGNILSYGLGFETELVILSPGPGELGFALIAIIPMTFFPMLLSSPIFEEPAWRGFVLPKVQSMFGRELGSLFIGSYWWLWHQMMNVSFGIYPSLPGYLGILALSFMTDSIFNLSKRNVLAAMFVHSSSFVTLTYIYTPVGDWSKFIVITVVWAFVILLRLLEKKRGLPGSLALTSPNMGRSAGENGMNPEHSG